jgi:hypothetical protein
VSIRKDGLYIPTLALLELRVLQVLQLLVLPQPQQVLRFLQRSF